ncbi:unnamed protein product [Brassicogethes aeneus]|uniref:GPI-anchor transamidase component GPAA1 n=1 Tax=Brassicogethes aeneus TaxID=1431903 RepID=A0A9P0AXJ1_BRAAE|nr:unnamed protein product [Brassicogethes aeneus]
MGLLTDPSAEQGKATKALLKYHTKLSLLLYLSGVVWFCVLAYPSMNASTYFSENALLPGLVKSEFREDKSAERFLHELEDEMKKYKDSVPYSWILAKFQQIGLDTYTHNFTLNSPLKINEKYPGKNVYGILRAPRASSTEALVLSVPYRPASSPHLTTAPSIAIMLAFAKYANRNNYWAKDIIFLITEHEQLGVQAWLEAYHGATRGYEGILDSGDLRGRAGAIQAAINLEFHEARIGQMDIKIEGLNGQLPNLDLFNLAVKMCTKEGLSSTFKGRANEYYREPFDVWFHYFKTLMAMFFTQATGIPNGNHGLFHSFGIQSLTMEGFGQAKIRATKVGFLSTGRILEGIFRSLNNLLERFHQSFFFYLLPSSDRYISIGLYMPAVCLIAASLIIKACAKWCKLQETPENESGKKSLARKGMDNINFERIITIFLLAHIIGMLIKYSPQYLIKISEEHDLPATKFVTNTLFAFCALSFAVVYLVSFKTCSNSMTVLNIFALLELGTTLICISMNNFSLGMFCATIWAPIALFINPTSCKYYSYMQRILWLCLHPLAILTTVVMINTYTMFRGEKLDEIFSRGLGATNQAIVFSIVDSMIYGNWLYTFVTSVLLPNWLCFWCVSFSVSKDNEKEEAKIKKTN